MTPYDPIESLREEVNRFLATNTFTPMLVTGFYVQAKVVLAEVDRLRAENQRLYKLIDEQGAKNWHAGQLVGLLTVAAEALENSYDATEWPADGSSVQEVTAKRIREIL